MVFEKIIEKLRTIGTKLWTMFHNSANRSKLTFHFLGGRRKGRRLKAHIATQVTHPHPLNTLLFLFRSNTTMSMRMQTLKEEEEYNWPADRRPARDIVIAVDHGPKSKHAFDWVLLNFCRAGDTIHLVHAVSSLKNNIVYEASQTLMEKLTLEAVKVAMVKTVTRIVEGDAGKAICKEAENVKPIAVVMGTRGRSLMQSVLKGSVSEYCFHNCKAAPVIIVPGIVEAEEESVVSVD
ncbi:hypothetical protein LXL04_001716 [Taraxacum kok-saghyz]